MTTAVLEIDGVSAQRRLAPASADELAEALHAADLAGQAVAPVGGGTQLDLGMPPNRLDAVIETTRLDQVVEYEPADLTITVEAGIRFATLQSLLAKQGQFLALDPPADVAATLGGLIATNASGPLRFAHGTARDLVIGTRVANADGALTRSGGRVVKNVAGYDLNKLYIGSLGTLGIIVELSLKLAPIPPATASVIAQFADLDDVRRVLSAVIHSPLSPLAVELLAPMASSAAGLTPAHLVVFRVGGYPQAVERQVRDLSELLAQRGGQRVDASQAAWDDLAASRLAALRRPIVLKAAAPISASTTLLNVLETRLQGLDPIVWSHAGSGVAFAACDVPTDATGLLEARREIAGLGSNASLVIQRCPTLLKAEVDVWGDPGSSLPLMRALKNKLDPRGTLNPGRYVGGL
ncbi:MAG TPA: FAD-binding oxidoreductase [Chloroflexota bacterium]|nr:FAD-binding oxidoreductase [Chloroflexota bacterium]